MNLNNIINQLPYTKPFLFVDELTEINDKGVKGNYTFPEDSYFYQGHFKNFPVTPGVILTECTAQIGLVCFGIYLISEENKVIENIRVALSSSLMDFYYPVFPGERVRVESEKVYFRFHKLKCKAKMYNSHDKLVCQGTISGMLKQTDE